VHGAGSPLSCGVLPSVRSNAHMRAVSLVLAVCALACATPLRPPVAVGAASAPDEVAPVRPAEGSSAAATPEAAASSSAARDASGLDAPVIAPEAPSGIPLQSYLPPAQVEAVIRAGLDQVRACFTTQKEPCAYEGQYRFRWRIDRTGAVSKVESLDTQAAQTVFAQCLAEVIRHWQFPMPDGGEVSVQYPFIMQHRNECGLAGGARPSPVRIPALAPGARRPQQLDQEAANAALNRHYPPELKKAGVAGQAIVVALVNANGTATPMVVERATYPEFGRACMLVIPELRFEPARDMNGRAVEHSIRFTCQFEQPSPADAPPP